MCWFTNDPRIIYSGQSKEIVVAIDSVSIVMAVVEANHGWYVYMKDRFVSEKEDWPGWAWTSAPNTVKIKDLRYLHLKESLSRLPTPQLEKLLSYTGPLCTDTFNFDEETKTY